MLMVKAHLVLLLMLTMSRRRRRLRGVTHLARVLLPLTTMMME